MKAKYLKPASEVVPLMDKLMISASILEGTGQTSIDQIMEGDGRESSFTDWGDEVNLSDWDEEKLF
jgi:hypothetical protein